MSSRLDWLGGEGWLGGRRWDGCAMIPLALGRKASMNDSM